MIIVLALALIMAASMNILSLRRQRERLQIFDLVTHSKGSFLSELQEMLDRNQFSYWRTFSYNLIKSSRTNYFLLFNDSYGSNKMQNIGIIIIGTIAGVILDQIYIGVSIYLALPISLFLTSFILIFIRKKQLKKHFYEHFPETLNIIIGVVTAGSSVSTAFNECAAKLTGPTRYTMREIANRLEIGENANSVLLDSYRNLPFPEYYFFILTIMVNLEGGGEVKEVLSRLGKMLISNRMLAKTRDSKTAELRMTVIILAAIPALFIVILYFIAPENYKYLVNTTGGHWILGYVIVSVLSGIFFIRKMINKVV